MAKDGMSPQSFSQSATNDKRTASFSEIPPLSMRQSLNPKESAEKMKLSANQEEDETSDASFLSNGQPFDLNKLPKRRKLSPIIEEDNTLDQSSLSTTQPLDPNEQSNKRKVSELTIKDSKQLLSYLGRFRHAKFPLLEELAITE
ncbi:hypothetical protein MMC14_006698 [Varicellaria rhodocarpa]|nr:hypothetical protein [Varicellaria rhodocarpa]